MNGVEAAPLLSLYPLPTRTRVTNGCQCSGDRGSSAGPSITQPWEPHSCAGWRPRPPTSQLGLGAPPSCSPNTCQGGSSWNHLGSGQTPGSQGVSTARKAPPSLPQHAPTHEPPPPHQMPAHTRAHAPTHKGIGRTTPVPIRVQVHAPGATWAPRSCSTLGPGTSRAPRGRRTLSAAAADHAPLGFSAEVRRD